LFKQNLLNNDSLITSLNSNVLQYFWPVIIKSFCREAKSYVSNHLSKHQCTRLDSVPNLNSQTSSPISEG